MPARIEDYALLGDLQTAALVGRDGSVDWLCLPRFDSGASLAALLGDEENGHWRLAPAAGGPAARRRYRGDTLILESEWDTPEGTVRVVDLMPPRGEAPDVVRIVQGVSGRVPMRGELRLRFDYGQVVPWVHHTDGQLVAVAGPDAMWLHTPVRAHGEDFATLAEFTVHAGQSVPFVLTWRESHLPAPKPVDPVRALVDTERFWTAWAGRADYDGLWREAVIRSLVVLRALTYAPTGGIVAAATTSLPEQLGGVRNWDYRYCWLRDAAFTLQALLGAGYAEEARAWRSWLLRAVAGDPADMQIMYGLDGRRRLPEWEVAWLAGYEGARPVRVGNAAAGQFQLDVYGEVMDTLHLARGEGLEPDDAAWDLQQALLDYLEGHWDAPDSGLWEMRGPARHFVHSKVMAWVAFDRAVRTVEASRLGGPVERWRAARVEIHREVCARGYDPERNTFTQFYGSRGLDAALLLIPQVGFLPPHDPRVVGTVDAVARELMHGGFLRRYDPQADAGPGAAVDGLPGGEGAFLACTFWLADALALLGRRGPARRLFERLLELRNDVGLLSEEYDPRTGRLVGNMPQAFSHVPLVNTARNLSGSRPPALRRGRPDATGGPRPAPAA
ncbi:MAG TPA: glycoside hydrolase family 15 protein [Frankiaceae bacterium]|nr:glycoside hydrolase family 15 protein [Frankiaceae bacterium]